ncbi:hypothetical protein [Stenotrophomonas sp. MMGLT7]|uniref:hypothetical protein n=1 Tax=Stenotrophomonas sp. MMGLT7 TaxID=2901227 RepID=UPI001E37161E|nr:hypothetical protein [Stenotrophomonas sp. MMGLT7]
MARERFDAGEFESVELCVDVRLAVPAARRAGRIPQDTGRVDSKLRRHRFALRCPEVPSRWNLRAAGDNAEVLAARVLAYLDVDRIGANRSPCSGQGRRPTLTGRPEYAVAQVPAAHADYDRVSYVHAGRRKAGFPGGQGSLVMGKWRANMSTATHPGR